MTENPKEVHDYNEVVAFFRERADEIGLSMAVLDEITGLASGYSGHIFGPSRRKMMGFLAFFTYAEALACKVQIVPDLDAAKRMEGRWAKRDELRRRAGVIRRPISPEMLKKVSSEIGRIRGSTAKQFRISAEQRSRINKRNAKLGWRKRKNGSPPSVKSGSSGAYAIPVKAVRRARPASQSAPL